MRCQDVLGMLSPYLDGVLDSAEREAVRAHLVGCPKCSAEFEELRACLNLLKELPDLTPPANFSAKLMEQINQLSVPQQVAHNKRWYERITDITSSTWYRTAAVAAVLAMAIGITSLWEKQGNQFMPVDTKSGKVVVDTQEPHEPNNNEPDSSENNPTKEQTNNNVKPDSNSKTPDSKETKPTNTVAPASTATVAVKQVENFVPQPSEGLVASSVTLKLDVQELETALKAIDKITQDNSGSVYQSFSGSDESGTIGIKVSRNQFSKVISSLRGLGPTISYLPIEKDLGDEHQKAKGKLEELKAKRAELQAKMSEEANSDLEKQLAEVNNAMIEQVNIMKKLEDRSTYSLIDITII